MCLLEPRVVNAMYRYARKYDAEDIAGFTLMRAAESFDPTFGLPFERWAMVCIRLAARRRPRRTVSLEVDLEAPPGDDEPDPEQPLFCAMVEHYIERMPLVSVAERAGLSVHVLRGKMGAYASRLLCNSRKV